MGMARWTRVSAGAPLPALGIRLDPVGDEVSIQSRFAHRMAAGRWIAIVIAAVAAVALCATYRQECAVADRCLASHRRLLAERAAGLRPDEPGRGIVPFERIPNHLVQAILSTEDPRFFARRRIGGCGDSWTLSERVARGCFPSPEASLKRRVQEAVLAWALERRAAKKEIFEIYANEVLLGRAGSLKIEGVGEAAQAYFGKETQGLSLSESALLAGMIASPMRYDPRRRALQAAGRRNLVLKLLQEDRFIGSRAAEAASREPLGVIPERAAPTTILEKAF
jgi:membrane peptidoglycan carboxypeptidase